MRRALGAMGGAQPLWRTAALSRTSYDEHLLTVVGAHLVRAIKRAETQLGESLFDNESAAALPLLRNLYEHWDEQRPAFADPSMPKALSGKTFTERFPQGAPWSVTYSGDELFLGRVVPIYALTIDLAAVESRVLALEESYRSPHQIPPPS